MKEHTGRQGIGNEMEIEEERWRVICFTASQTGWKPLQSLSLSLNHPLRQLLHIHEEEAVCCCSYPLGEVIFVSCSCLQSCFALRPELQCVFSWAQEEKAAFSWEQGTLLNNHKLWRCIWLLVCLERKNRRGTEKKIYFLSLFFSRYIMWELFF